MTKLEAAAIMMVSKEFGGAVSSEPQTLQEKCPVGQVSKMILALFRWFSVGQVSKMILALFRWKHLAPGASGSMSPSIKVISFSTAALEVHACQATMCF